MAKLTETKLKAARPAERPYKLFDANGLYLQVPPSGSPRWRVRLVKDGREQHLSLGTYPEVALDDARARAAQLRVANKNGAAPEIANLAAELRGAERPHPVRVVAPSGDSLQEVHDEWRKHVNGALASSTRTSDERAIGYVLFELGPREPMGHRKFKRADDASSDAGAGRTRRRGAARARRRGSRGRRVFAWGGARDQGWLNAPPSAVARRR